LKDLKAHTKVLPLMSSKEKSRGSVKPPLDQPTDYSDATASIERDLNKHRIGTFRVNSKDMTFTWSDRQNREVKTMERMSKLYTSMRNGLYRTDIRHRMSGVIAAEVIENSIVAPDNHRKMITLDDTKNYNEQAMFPHILVSEGQKQKIEMQSGQHRMAVLRVIYPEQEDQWWWIVTLYDRGIIPFITLLMIELPDVAKEALRLNEQDYRVAETEVDIWNQIIYLDGKLTDIPHDRDAKLKFEAAKKRYELGLGQRTKSLLSMSEYVEVINRILKMPGMHIEFSSKNFEVFSKGRTVEVPFQDTGHAPLLLSQNVLTYSLTWIY
jgi:hypothetical protein